MAFLESSNENVESLVEESADPFFFEADSQRRALSYANYTLNQAHGVFLLTGEPGCGKSTLVAHIARDLEQRGGTVVSFPSQRIEGRDVYRQVAEEFGLPHYSVPQPELLDTLEKFLIKCVSSGSRPLLIIDNAGRLTDGDMIAITDLCDLRDGDDYLLQVILVAQHFPKLNFMSRREPAGVNHLVASYHLSPILKEEVGEYFKAWAFAHNVPDLPVLPPDLRDRVYLWSRGCMGRLQPLVELAAGERSVSDNWEWSEPVLAHLIAAVESGRRPSHPPKTPPLHERPDPDREQIEPTDSGQMRSPVDRGEAEESRPVTPLHADTRIDADTVSVPGWTDEEVAPQVQKALDTPLAAVCNGVEEAYLLTPLLKTLARALGRCTLLHTGDELDVEALDWSRGMASVVRVRPYAIAEQAAGDAAQQMVEQMQRATEFLQGGSVHCVLALNDSDATLSMALTARKQGIPVIRVEAGKRWSDSTHNRNTNQMLIDRLSSLLLVGDSLSEANLLMEGVSRDHIREVGTLRVDALARVLAKQGISLTRAADPSQRGAKADRANYALIALRNEQLSTPEKMEVMLRVLRDIGELVPVRLLVAPKLKHRLERSSFVKQQHKWNIDVFTGLDPVRSIPSIEHARLVITDSEFMQVEATALRIPCITLAKSTLWPSTIENGSNRLCPFDPAQIVAAVNDALADDAEREAIPSLWDGRSAKRAIKAVSTVLPKLALRK